MGSGSGGSGGGGGGGGELGQPAPPSQSAEEVLGPARVLDTSDINPGGQITGQGELVENLPTQDIETIRSYTGGAMVKPKVMALKADDLNSILREPYTAPQVMKKAARVYEKDLNMSLSKVKSYKGETYRVIEDSGGAIAAKYSPGNIVKQNEFISTSRSPNAAAFSYTRARSGSTRFKIQSKTGKPIEKTSYHQTEHEVLFRSGSRFKVTSKTWNEARNTWDIGLTEI